MNIKGWDLRYGDPRGLQRLVGRTINAVYINNTKTEIAFEFVGGGYILFETEGDCCSSSWVHDLSGLDALIGGTVLSVESVGTNAEWEGEFSLLQTYFEKIKTDKGYCDFSYRNESNGYYGGSIIPIEVETEEYFSDGSFKKITDDF